MLTLLINRTRLHLMFSQINKQQILNSSYQQLVERIARTYNLKEYKNQSGLCLLEMHHQFRLFSKGDWVLDVGAGKEYAWSDLALKLTQNQQMTHKVISNDVIDLRKNRENNVFVRGDISEEPVQTKIALQLQNRNLDTILVDVSPEYTGNVNNQGRAIMETAGQVLYFASTFLKKGGNLVCKVLQSQAEPLLDQTFSIYFNEKYKYIPSVVRKSSPVCFYVMKGFMMSESYHALQEFVGSYGGTAENKTKLVEKYKGRYAWDPVKQIKKVLLDQVVRMRNEGYPEKRIINMLGNDPYLKVQRVLKLLKQADEAKKQRNMVLHFKIMNEITQGELYKTAQHMPTNFDEFYQGVLEKMDETIKEDKEKKAARKERRISRAPLNQNESYMKAEDQVKQRQEVMKTYLPGDLQGRYSGRMTEQQIQLQAQKITKIHPEVSKLAEQLQIASKDDSQKTIQQILQQSKRNYEQLDVESLRNIQEAVEQSVREMSQEDVREERKLEGEMYRSEVNGQRVEKKDRFVNQRRAARKRPIY